MAKPATRAEWKPEQGLLILHGGADGDPNPEAVALPIPTLRTLAAYARRYGVTAETPGAQAVWPALQPVEAETFEAHVLTAASGDRISLVIDRGLDTEMGFSFTPAEARALVKTLTSAAARAGVGKPSRN